MGKVKMQIDYHSENGRVPWRLLVADKVSFYYETKEAAQVKAASDAMLKFERELLVVGNAI